MSRNVGKRALLASSLLAGEPRAVLMQRPWMETQRSSQTPTNPTSASPASPCEVTHLKGPVPGEGWLAVTWSHGYPSPAVTCTWRFCCSAAGTTPCRHEI